VARLIPNRSERDRNDVHPAQRVGVLTDSQNLYHTAQSLHSRNVDYAALLE
jgi:hypothetical protein